VHPLLAGLYSLTNEAPGYGWSIQTVPWEQLHELPHLPIVLWLLILADPFLRDVTGVAKGGSVGFFSDVKPFLVPITDEGVPRAAEVFRFHSVMKCQVHSAGDLRSPLGPLLPKTEYITKEIEMGSKSTKCFVEVNEGGDEKD
jgi:hypothetical protein